MRVEGRNSFPGSPFGLHPRQVRPSSRSLGVVIGLDYGVDLESD